MNKIAALQEVEALFAGGLTYMIGGFLAVGTPERLVDMLISKGVQDITLIANDTGFIDKGIGKLIVNKRVKKAIVSHIGTNAESGRQMHDGQIQMELVPQGTLAERIRCGGAGLGGILTPTGVGTMVETGKERKEINGKIYLLELPLRADIALIKAWKADLSGNLVFRRSARNFNPLMAMAADLVVVEAEEICETGALDPDEVMTPGILVDMIIPSKD
ncbi:MAG: acetate CoA-transferase subunit alpha [Clostridia bacterium]|jgi:acetate CoA/acetoacetate CoA-transferase alpha subunit|nr:acetate CoA-transferase subunit alpha [Clostridia bacterium]